MARTFQGWDFLHPAELSPQLLHISLLNRHVGNITTSKPNIHRSWMQTEEPKDYLLLSLERQIKETGQLRHGSTAQTSLNGTAVPGSIRLNCSGKAEVTRAHPLPRSPCSCGWIFSSGKVPSPSLLPPSGSATFSERQVQSHRQLYSLF